MLSKSVSYQRMIFVCTNTREGGKVACANPGREGNLICEKLKTYVKEAGLKKKVRVARSGCMDLCSLGPNVIIWSSSASDKPEGVWCQGVTESDLPLIIQKHIDPLKDG